MFSEFLWDSRGIFFKVLGKQCYIPKIYKTAAALAILRKLLLPYTPRHNGKVERSHREDQRRFYSLADFDAQLAVHQSTSNYRPKRPLHDNSPTPFCAAFLSNMFDKPTINFEKQIDNLP